MTATTLHDVALTIGARGDQASAEPMFRQAMEIHRKALSETHPLVAVTLNSLSRLLREQGRYDEALDALQKALAIARPALGNDHQLVAIYALNLASVHLARGEPAVAEPLIRDALRIRLLAPQAVPNRRRILPEDDWSIGAREEPPRLGARREWTIPRGRDRAARGASGFGCAVATAAAGSGRGHHETHRALYRVGQACRSRIAIGRCSPPPVSTSPGDEP